VSRFSGASCAEIAASASACFELVCDTPRTPQWHQAIAAVQVLERDADGRTSLVRASIDALVAKVDVDLRLSYEEPHAVHMRRESGELRDLTVTWTFQELGPGLTRAAFETEFDPGRVLSLFARGPVVAQLNARLAEQPPAGLKGALEGS
jgi:ribosome-associated toxin RatA of RatAB toxin-antitoxin module